MGEGGRERERESQRERDRKKNRDRDRDRQRQREIGGVGWGERREGALINKELILNFKALKSTKAITALKKTNTTLT